MFHRVFQEYLDEHSEKNLYPVLNGTTIGGARTIAELKAESALEDAIAAAGQANTTRKLAEKQIAEAEEEVRQGQKENGDYINLLYKREKDAEQEVLKEFNEWAKTEEIKERPAVQEIKNSLADLGATEEHIKPLSEFAGALDKPVTGKNGKTYVEVPAPKILLPLLKGVVRKMLGAFEWMRGTQERVRERVEQARTSIKEKLPQKKREADQWNEARRAANSQQRMIQNLRKNDHSL